MLRSSAWAITLLCAGCVRTVTPAPADLNEPAAPEPAPVPEPAEPVEAEPAAPAAEAVEAPAAEATPSVEIPEVSQKLVDRILAQQARVQTYAAKHEIDPDLVNAVIWVESKFDPRAKGPAGAMGLMQLMPRTAGSLAKRLERRSRPYDPDFNIDAGCLYIRRILRRFDGDERLSLAAYNRGVGKVKSWVEAGEDLPERTAAYVDRVLAVKAWIPALIAREGGVTEPPKVAADAPVATLAGPSARVILAP